MKKLYVILGICIFLLVSMADDYINIETFDNMIKSDMSSIVAVLQNIPRNDHHILYSTQMLMPGESIVSPNGLHVLLFRDNGQLTIVSNNIMRNIGPTIANYNPGFCLLDKTGELIFTSSNNYNKVIVNNSPQSVNLCMPVFTIGSPAMRHAFVRLIINDNAEVYTQNQDGNILWSWTPTNLPIMNNLTTNITTDITTATNINNKLISIISNYNMSDVLTAVKVFSAYDNSKISIKVDVPINHHINRVSFKYDDTKYGVNQLINPTIGYKTNEEDFNILKILDDKIPDTVIGDPKLLLRNVGFDCKGEYLNSFDVAVSSSNNILFNYTCVNSKGQVTNKQTNITPATILAYNPTQSTISCMCDDTMKYITNISIDKKGDNLQVKSSCSQLPTEKELQTLALIPTTADIDESHLARLQHDTIDAKNNTDDTIDVKDDTDES